MGVPAPPKGYTLAAAGAPPPPPPGYQLQHPAAPQPRSLLDDVTGFMANVNRGLGVGDELAAGAKTVSDMATGHGVQAKPTVADTVFSGASLGMFSPETVANFRATFGRSMGGQRQVEDSYAAAHPNLAALGRGTGMAATVAVPGPAALAQAAPASRLVNALRGAATAGLTGAAYAAVDRGTPAERVRYAAAAARNPIILGLGAAGGALAPTAKPSAPRPPSLEELTAAKNAAYKAVDDAGVEYKPEAVSDLVQGVQDDTQQAMIDPDLHPKASAVVKRIGQLKGQPVTLGKLDQIRRLARDNAIVGASPDEARIGRRIVQNIDEFIDAAGPDQITAASGDPAQASASIQQARDLNTRVRKIETVNDALEAARLRAGSTGSGGNINNAIRQNLRGVLQRGRFSPDESQALENIVLGTPGQNALRQVGKLSPSGNGLSFMLHAGAAVPTHGASLGVAGVGMASKFAADQITKSRVADLVNLIATGSQGPEASAAEDELAQIAQSALQGPATSRLARGAGVAGAGSTAAGRDTTRRAAPTN